MAFDLDDDELKSTRKLLGVDKEDNLTILENFLKEMDDMFQKTKINNTKERNALRELISEYKQQEQKYLNEVDKHVDVVLLYNSLLNKIKSYDKELENARKINEEHRKENGLLRERVKELEAKLEFKQYGDLDDLRFEEYMNEFIPKQKIKDKMKKYEWAIKCYDSSIADYKQSQTVGKWAALQALLQEREDK